MKVRRFLACAASVTIAVAVVAGVHGSDRAVAQGSCEPGSGGNSCGAADANSPDPTTLIGSKSPALSGKNLTGKGTLDLSSIVTKPTAVVFWLNSCPHCRKEMPGVNRLGRRVGPHAQIVAVAINGGLKGPKGYETPKAAAKTMHLTIPTILASKAQAMAWRVPMTPIAFILDSNGVVTQVIQFGEGNLQLLINRDLDQTT
jgi:thiol-disulfide isomerase/thioredoxin